MALTFQIRSRLKKSEVNGMLLWIKMKEISMNPNWAQKVSYL